MRTDKTYYTANYLDEPSSLDQVAVLPADTDLNKFTETIGSPWVANKIQWASKFRSVLALRGDDGKGVITSFTNPTNPNYPNDPLPCQLQSQYRPIGQQVPAQPQSKFDLRPVGQYGVLCAGRIQLPHQRRAWLNATV